MIQREAFVHAQVTDYLRLQYPKVYFRTDMGGVRLTIAQAKKARRVQHSRAWPDLFIAEPRGGKAGLFIELKATKIYKKDGTLLKDDHLQEQAFVLEELSKRGYAAFFCVGFPEARKTIDSYMALP